MYCFYIIEGEIMSLSLKILEWQSGNNMTSSSRTQKKKKKISNWNELKNYSPQTYFVLC